MKDIIIRILIIITIVVVCTILHRATPGFDYSDYDIRPLTAAALVIEIDD